MPQNRVGCPVSPAHDNNDVTGLFKRDASPADLSDNGTTICIARGEMSQSNTFLAASNKAKEAELGESPAKPKTETKVPRRTRGCRQNILKPINTRCKAI